MGKPLIGHSIDLVKKWGRADEIVVSTDSEEISACAKSFGALVPFMRPAELATDTAAKLPVITHALKETQQLCNKTFDIVMDLDPTSPLRTLNDLDQSLALFLLKQPKTVLSVVPAHKSPYFNMVETSDNGFAKLSKSLQTQVLRRQDAPKVFNMNASIYVYSADYLLNGSPTSAISDESIIYEMNPLSEFDIDRELDFKLVEFFVKEGLFQFESI